MVKREQPQWFARVPDHTRRELALGRLKSEIRETLDLPNFEYWSKNFTQQPAPIRGIAGCADGYSGIVASSLLGYDAR